MFQRLETPDLVNEDQKLPETELKGGSKTHPHNFGIIWKVTLILNTYSCNDLQTVSHRPGTSPHKSTLGRAGSETKDQQSSADDMKEPKSTTIACKIHRMYSNPNQSSRSAHGTLERRPDASCVHVFKKSSSTGANFHPRNSVLRERSSTTAGHNIPKPLQMMAKSDHNVSMLSIRPCGFTRNR